MTSRSVKRLQGISYDASTADTTYTIAPAPSVAIKYMTTGDKTRVRKVTTSGVATEENTFDSEGRISDYTLSFANRTAYPIQTSYSYDTASRLTQVTYPAQYGIAGTPRQVVAPGYDVASRLTQLTVDGQTQMNDVAFNAFGQATQVRTGASTGNGDLEQYSYDAQTGLLTNQKVYKSSNTTTPILDLSYGYDRGGSVGSLAGKTGNLTKITNNLDRNKDRAYEFDAVGRLIKAKGGLAASSGTGATASWTQDYSYDRYGNKTGVAAAGVDASAAAIIRDGIASLSFDANTNRISLAGWQYDNAGNLLRGQNETGAWQRFEYDAAGRLVKIKDDAGAVIETYTYGADRKRLVRDGTSSRTYFAWGGSSPIQEYLEGTTATNPVYSKSYVYAGTRLLSTVTNTGSGTTVEFHHPDRLGTKLVTKPSANTYFEQSTMPFGTAFGGESSGATNQRFSSYDRNELTKLDYAKNRTYSPGMGQFTQVDPIGMLSTDAGSPQSLNLMSYVQSNPVDHVDPSGLFIAAVGYIPPPRPELDWFTFWWLNQLFNSTPGGGGDPGEPGGGGGGGGGREKKTLCDSLAANDKFNDFARKLWDKGRENEATGVFGNEIDDGSRRTYNDSTYEIYDKTGTPVATTADAIQWRVDTINDNKKTINYYIIAHTHPMNADGTYSTYPSSPATNGEGRGDTVRLQWTREQTKNSTIMGIVVTDKKFAVFGVTDDGKVICTGTWK